MESHEDDALLFLIYQHLQQRGFKKAAQKLEKYVSQVRKRIYVSSLRYSSVWSALFLIFSALFRSYFHWETGWGCSRVWMNDTWSCQTHLTECVLKHTAGPRVLTPRTTAGDGENQCMWSCSRAFRINTVEIFRCLYDEVQGLKVLSAVGCAILHGRRVSALCHTLLWPVLDPQARHSHAGVFPTFLKFECKSSPSNFVLFKTFQIYIRI